MSWIDIVRKIWGAPINGKGHLKEIAYTQLKTRMASIYSVCILIKNKRMNL